MIRYALILACCLAAGTTCASSAFAENFRISTTIYDLSTAVETGKPKAIATSLSLFHHRKVYDYISTAGEVMIFEPATNKFTIFSTSRSLATTVDFDEIKHLIKVGKSVTEQYIGQQQKLGTSTSNQVADVLKFQLNPKFDQEFDATNQTLSLTAPHISYIVECATVESFDSVNRYLDYADWMARVNYILHPRAMYPEPRIALNNVLRERKLFPTQVELRARIEADITLRARHSVSWKLSSYDRSLITRWESLLNSDDVRKVPFRQYQETVLMTDRNR